MTDSGWVTPSDSTGGGGYPTATPPRTDCGAFFFSHAGAKCSEPGGSVAPKRIKTVRRAATTPNSAQLPRTSPDPTVPNGLPRAAPSAIEFADLTPNPVACVHVATVSMALNA